MQPGAAKMLICVLLTSKQQPIQSRHPSHGCAFLSGTLSSHLILSSPLVLSSLSKSPHLSQKSGGKNPERIKAIQDTLAALAPVPGAPITFPASVKFLEWPKFKFCSSRRSWQRLFVQQRHRGHTQQVNKIIRDKSEHPKCKADCPALNLPIPEEMCCRGCCRGQDPWTWNGNAMPEGHRAGEAARSTPSSLQNDKIRGAELHCRTERLCWKQEMRWARAHLHWKVLLP